MFSRGNPLSCPSCTRRGFLRTGAGAAAFGAAMWLPGSKEAVAAGATDDFQPYPIPWLDGNLHHNQVPMPNSGPTEWSHIYHFKGQVARTIIAEGQGQTGDGKTLYVGEGTDYSYMQGKYITASGDEQFGAFSHI